MIAQAIPQRRPLNLAAIEKRMEEVANDPTRLEAVVKLLNRRQRRVYHAERRARKTAREALLVAVRVL